MTEGPIAPADRSQMELDAKEIVSGLLKEKPGLIDEAQAVFENEPAEDLSKLLGTGDSVIEGEAEPGEEDEEEIIVPADEDIETIMRELLDENPGFAEVEEEVRRQIVTDAICTVLAEET